MYRRDCLCKNPYLLPWVKDHFVEISSWTCAFDSRWSKLTWNWADFSIVLPKPLDIASSVTLQILRSILSSEHVHIGWPKLKHNPKTLRTDQNLSYWHTDGLFLTSWVNLTLSMEKLMSPLRGAKIVLHEVPRPDLLILDGHSSLARH